MFQPYCKFNKYKGKDYKSEADLTSDDQKENGYTAIKELCGYETKCHDANCELLNEYKKVLGKAEPYDLNCKTYTCVKEKSADNNYYESKDFICANKCEKCFFDTEKEKNTCVHVDEDPCLTAENGYDPLTMIDGCSNVPRCDENIKNEDGSMGGCTEYVDYCKGNTTACDIYKCEYQVEDGKIVNPGCVNHKVECTMPMYYSKECYQAKCVEEMDGCMIIVDYDKLNECGECAGYGTCDESSVVVAAAISAGVVAGIVIAAVAALSVGLVASKKMYDMITGAQEASMDAAHENALYQEEEAGGTNPLFEEQ